MPTWACLAAVSLLVAGPLQQGGSVGASISGRCEGGAASTPYLWPDYGGGCQMTLTSARARVEVAGVLARVVANYTYISEQASAIEDATVSLSAPAGVALVGFAVHLPGGRVPMRGDVQVLASDNVSPHPSCPRSSLSWDSHDASTASDSALRVPIGQVKPGDTLTVEVEHVREVHTKLEPEEAGGTLQLTLLLPAGARRQSGRLSAAGAGSSASSRVSIELGVASPAGTATALEVRCPTTGVVVSQQGHQQGLTSATVRSEALQDVTVEIVALVHSSEAEKACPAHALSCGGKQEAPFSPELLIQRHPSSGLLAAALMLPSGRARSAPKGSELVLILDRSASMRGLRLSRVRNAAQTFLRSLPWGAQVNFVGFASDASAAAKPLFVDGSRALDAEAFAVTVQHIKGTDAGQAGLQKGAARGLPEQPAGIRETLRVALTQLPRAEETQLRLIVITDRHPVDTDDAVEYIEENCHSDCRLSTVGVGWGASPPFVEGSAKAGGGSASFVAERGGAAALERTLIAHLVEALQPVVRDVQVDWGALAAALGAGSCPKGSVELQGAAEGNVDAFVAQGGVCGLQAVPVQASTSGGAGRRLLALAFLGGSPAAPPKAPQRLSVRAMVAGQPAEAQLALPPETPVEGVAAHLLGAWHLARALEQDEEGGQLPSAPGRRWQLRALGIAYSLATAETGWVARGGEVAHGGEDEDAVALDSAGKAPADAGATATRVQCPRQAVNDRALAGGSGALGAAAQTDVSSSSASGRDFESTLSVRQASKAGNAALSVFPGLRHAGAALSSLDLASLGTSLALRNLPARPSKPSTRWDLGSFDSSYLGASLSLRSLRPFGGSRPGALDFLQLGSSLAVSAGLPRASRQDDDERRPWWQDDADWDFRGGDPLYGDPLGWGDDLRAPPGGGPDPPGRPLATREHRQLGQSLSMTGAAKLQRLGERLSTVDFIGLGASLSLRGLRAPGSAPHGAYGGAYGGFGGYGDYGGPFSRTSSLAVLDYLFMGSSLAMGSYGLGRRSLSGAGAKRLRDWDGYPDELDPFDYGSWDAERAGAGGGSLSLRSFSQMSSALSIAENGGLATPTKAKLSSQLSALDWQHLGASLSLRSLSASPRSPGLPFSGGRRAWPPARASGMDVEGDLDYYGTDAELTSVASMLSVRPLWDWPASTAAAAVGGGRSAWISIRLAGGLLAPLLQVSRSGSSRCTPRDQAAKVTWGSGPGLPVPGPAELYLTFGPLLSPGTRTSSLGSVEPPAKKRKKKRKKVELPITLQLSHWCELTVFSDDPRADMGPALVTTEPLAELQETPGLGSPEELRSALRDWQAARELLAGAGPVAEATSDSTVAAQPGTDAQVVASAEPLDAVAVSTFPTSGPGAGWRAQDEDPDPARYYALVGAQQLDGSFEFGEGPPRGGNEAVAAAVEGSEPTTQNAPLARPAEESGLSAEHLALLVDAWGSRPLAHTAAALAALSAHHSSLRKGWALLAAKAESWLAEGDGVAAAATPCGAAPATCAAAADLAIVRWSPTPAPLRGIFR